ncbi:MAG: hypothetical protein ACK4S4_12175 [Pyrinomonadaceae bacterium]
MTFLRLVPAALAAIAAFTILAAGQNRFEGYSFTLDADESGSCPIRYLPSSGGKNRVDVFIAGTGLRTPATGLRGCSESTVNGNTVNPNSLGQWCFEGGEGFYEIRLTNSDSYLWYPVTRETGFYNVKDFRPVRRAQVPSPQQYTFEEPADYTRTIKNAVVYIASRLGGTLRFPDGDYVVGTLDGNRRDPNFKGITLPSGITVEGASSNYSLTTTTLPSRLSAARIRLRNTNQAIFRIGGCTNAVTLRNLELLGNAPFAGESQRDFTGTYGVEGLGKWAIDPVSKSQSPNSSQVLRFENMTFQNFDRAIYVHNVNEERCNPADQVCNQWQFDYVLVDHGLFLFNRTGIWIDTYNTDWKVTNTFFQYAAWMAPGDGIRVRKAGSLLLEQTFGGGTDYTSGIGGTFLNIDTIGTVTIISSGSERGKRSIYTNPLGAVSSMMMTVIGSAFGDRVELNGRMNYISTGNFYGPRTIFAEPNVNITSTGDRFCYDPLALADRCVDEAGRPVSEPGITGGRVMFQTGRVGEGSGRNRIESRPNFFGYNVELGNGLMQYDPNVTFRDITAWAAGTPDRPPVKDGALVYCKDCRRSPNGTCSQGTAGTDGAFAKRINGQWRCD